jgi:hypothetical protein
MVQSCEQKLFLYAPGLGNIQHGGIEDRSTEEGTAAKTRPNKGPRIFGLQLVYNCELLLYSKVVNKGEWHQWASEHAF